MSDDLLLDDDLDDSFIKDVDEEDIDLDAIDLLEGIGTEDPVRMAAGLQQAEKDQQLSGIHRQGMPGPL